MFCLCDSQREKKKKRKRKRNKTLFQASWICRGKNDVTTLGTPQSIKQPRHTNTIIAFIVKMRKEEAGGVFFLTFLSQWTPG